MKVILADTYANAATQCLVVELVKLLTRAGGHRPTCVTTPQAACLASTGWRCLFSPIRLGHRGLRLLKICPPSAVKAKGTSWAWGDWLHLGWRWGRRQRFMSLRPLFCCKHLLGRWAGFGRPWCGIWENAHSHKSPVTRCRLWARCLCVQGLWG